MSSPNPPNCTEVIRPLVTVLLIVPPLASVLVPLIITLFVFTTPSARRRPVFIFNIIACCFGILEALLVITFTTKILFHPLQPVSKALFMTASGFSVIAAIFVDSILTFRILAFYPPAITPNRKLLAIFALPILVKCGRIFTIVVVMYRLIRFATPAYIFSSAWLKSPYALAGAYLQVIDNSYASGILLYNIYRLRRQERRGVTIIRSKNFLGVLHSVLIIALGNFIFPVVINFITLILIAAMPISDLLKIAYLLSINNYIGIIGVVFATIWTRRRYWNIPDPSGDIQLESNGQANHVRVEYTRTVLSTLDFGGSLKEEESVSTGERQETLTGSKINSNLDTEQLASAKTEPD